MKLKSDWVVFVICVAASVFVWWHLNSQEYRTQSIVFYINYKLPDSLRLIGDVPEKFNVIADIRTRDFNDFKKRNHNPIIEFSLGTDSLQSVSKSALLNSVRELLSEYDVQRLRINDLDDIKLKIGKSYYKKIPVIFKSQINFYPGYEFTDSIRLSPDTITVFGLKEDIDTISYWPTEEFALVGVRNDINQLVKLSAPANNAITLSHTFVDVFIEVDQFTEKELWIEVTLLDDANIFQKGNVKILPSKARVFAKASIQYFNSLSETDFGLHVRSSEWKKGKSMVPIEVSRKPEKVKELKLYPKMAELIVHQ
jgi:YbbR domain-containing protein